MQGYDNKAVTGQPVAMGGLAGYAERVEPIPGCPPGLEFLASTDFLWMRAKVDIIEALTGWDIKNRYGFYNKDDQQVFFAYEESDTCMRQCCGPARAFVMHITNNTNQEVIRLVREFKCCAGCCWCASPGGGCSMDISVESPPGRVIGHVRQERTGWKIKLGLFNEQEMELGHLLSPCCVCVCPCNTVDFKLYDANMSREVGQVSKVWTNCCQEWCTLADQFKLEFPADMDVRTKTMLVAAAFLVDFMLFEHKDNGGG